MPAASRVHRLLEREHTLIFPGVYDALGAKLVERATLSFFHNRENLLLVGKTSMGKTHLAIALGHRLC